MAASIWDPQLFADAFCERRTLAPLDEPLNMATNLVLLGAAVALMRIAGQSRRPGGAVPLSMQTLIGLVFLMAFASITFHARPSIWSEAFDRAAVYSFVLYLIACFLHWMLGWRWRHALAAVPIMAIVAVSPRYLLPEPFASVVAMAPAVLVCAMFAWLLARRGDERWRVFVTAGASFALALIFHRADRPLCSMLPTGTHFLWHAFSGLTAYLAASTVLRQAIGVVLPTTTAARVAQVAVKGSPNRINAARATQSA